MAFKDIILAVAMAVKKAKAYTDSKTSGLSGGVNYKGSVNYYSNLPANPEEGDAYTVKYAGSSGAVVDGTEYVWGLNTDTNTMEWIEWSKDCYTKAETDSLLNGKQSTIDRSHKLASDLVDDTSSTNKFATQAQLDQIETNKTNISNKIGASDYATQTTGGTVRVWTTTSGGETTLHIANEAPTP
jgi:hypothetical protein